MVFTSHFYPLLKSSLDFNFHKGMNQRQQQNWTQTKLKTNEKNISRKKQELHGVLKFPIRIYWIIGAWNFEILFFKGPVYLFAIGEFT